ncbi:MAG: hypothetical protein JSW34_12265 [Candidatus Zixiibacteriota bacterium]|nr:MAG: hypothetical protein JSW34_12265 [candidate division Zixibacteria bacterium]
MKRIMLIMVLVLAMVPSAVQASVEAALSITDGRVSSFYLAIGDHYRVPEKEIIVVKKKEISDDDLAVVFFLARHANVAPSVIVDLRLGGRTWMEITTHFELSAAIYYVEIAKVSGPPYGKACGHFRNRHRDQWKSIKLTDVDIVNFVNLKFVSEHYGWSPDEVVRMREQGQSFIAISDKIKKEKSKKEADKPAKKDKGGKKGSGKKKK